MKISILRISIVFIAFNFILSACKKDEPSNQIQIQIGALVPLTGTGASVGESSYAAIQLAVDDIATSFIARGIDANLTVFVEDTETDPEVALQKIPIFTQKNIDICIGPFSSSNVNVVKEYANTNDLLIVSPASVSTSLAIPGDNVFRLVPSDDNQAEAMAAMLVDDGIEVLLPIVRDDLWGNELLAATTQFFSAAAGQMEEAVQYSPTTSDFTTYVNTLKNNLEAALAQYPAEKIGIYLVSYGESVNILNRASVDAIFEGVKWYGSSGFAGISTLPSDTIAANFAQVHQLACPAFGFDPAAQQKWEPLLERLQNLLGRQPEIYAFVTYDAVWLAVETYLSTGQSADFNTIKLTFENKANSTQGVTGVTTLNDAGDRLYATYDFWGIEKPDDEYEWAIVASYNNETGILERY